jgi:hypothetical protein
VQPEIHAGVAQKFIGQEFFNLGILAFLKQNKRSQKI